MSELASLRNTMCRYVIATLCMIFCYTSGIAQVITFGFTHDAKPCGSAIVNFVATVPTSVSPVDCVFEWDFGDGKPIKTGQSVFNDFLLKPGELHAPFLVKLTIWRISLLPKIQLFTITNAVNVSTPPIPVLKDINNLLSPFDNCANTPTFQNPLYTVTVGNMSKDINMISNYKINWGDGDSVQFDRIDFLSQNITHIYRRLGLFKLKFTAIGQNGCSDTKGYNVKNQGTPIIGMTSIGDPTGCAPVKFGFKVNGVYQNDPETSYVWDFGDGSPLLNWTTDSISKNDSTVYHTYEKSSCGQGNGSFAVKVTATNACRSANMIFSPVMVGIKPKPSFTSSNLCQGEDVQFINTTDPGMNYDCTKSVVYTWDFGDGSPTVITPNSTNIPHTFLGANNEYIVKLSAVNKCKDEVTTTKTITLIRRPIAIATLSPLKGCIPLTVNAINTSTGDSISSFWQVIPITGMSFVNGTNKNSVNPQFNFTTKGNYVITLQVKNKCVIDTIKYNVFVNGIIDVIFPNITNQCNAYTFDASIASVFKLNLISNEVVKANWQITPATGFTYLPGYSAQSLNPQIRFDSAGDYTLKVSLKNGCDSLTLTKTFKFAFAPIAKAVATVTEGCIPFNVHFTNQSTGYQAVSTWSVTPTTGAGFANGTTASSLNPDFRFDQAGNYTVKLSLTNSCGTNTMSFIIKAKGKPTASFISLPDICEKTDFTINSTYLNVSTNNGSIPIYDWVVTPNTGVSYQNGTFSNSANPSYAFAIPGTYRISVTVKNDCGIDTTSQKLIVRPLVRLLTSISDTSGCAPKTINFTDNSTGVQLTHLWSILPNSGFTYTTGNATSASPSILFTQAGIYTINHTLTGACSTQSKTFTVVISSMPTVNLSPITDQCTIPFKLLIDSTNFNINQNNKTISNIRWWTLPATGVTFKDGTNLNSKYPHFEFTSSGQFTVWVEVQNDCGTSTASRIFKILEHAAEHSTASDTVGCTPFKVTFTDQSTGDQLLHNWSVSPSTGWTITPSSTSASPDIAFNKTGIYTVTHKISNLCGTVSRTYTVKIKEPPSVLLSPLLNSCNSFTFIVDQQNMKVTTNLNDKISYIWTVAPNNAVTYLSNTSDTSHYPVIQIADTGVFKVMLKTIGECGFTETSQTINITRGPEISLTPKFPTNCLPANLTFSGTVYGQNLTYNWSILPVAGAIFIGGTTSTSAHPQILFSLPGNYSVSLNVINNCGNNFKKWDFTIIDKPTVVFNTVANTCDNFTFKSEQYVVVQDNGNAISNYKWVISPTNGFSYIDGTSDSSPLPHILFSTAGTYDVKMEATNDCGTSSASQSFTIDQFIQVEAGADTTLCTNNNLYLLNGSPAGGIWSILPASAANVLRVIGNSYFLDLNVPGNYTLTYKRGSSYCFSEDTRKFIILPLPVVNAGSDLTICENDKGTYQLAGIPVGGTWSGSGVTVNTFSTTGLANGSYILKYTWTDPVTSCSNTDQLIARLLTVPITGFTVIKQGCKDTPVLFTPNGPPNTLFNWNFGDGQTASSSGTINHTYRTGSTFTVTMISADPNNCSVSSSSKITIHDDISLPIVTVGPKSGCGPLKVTFTVDTTGTTGNGQAYNWNFGNGQTLNEAFTKKEVVYNSGTVDTTYNATLTISNSCFSRSENYQITVHALPNANFVMPHDWECSPTIVQFKNLTIDRTSTYYWDFGDGTTSTDYQPFHSYTTGANSKIYTIKLVAKNGCGKDSVSRPLLIKPNSIEAFLQINPRIACPGEVVTYTNFSTDTITKIMTYYWDFGDGTVSNTWNASHNYAAQGKYTVKLFIDNGCSYAEKTDQIEILPSLNLSIACRDSICLGDILNLEAISNLDGLINTKWDFGDNYLGTGSKTNHLYTTSGWKNITFTAASASGISHCSGTAVKRVYVKDAPIPLQLKDIEGCAPIKLSLKNVGPDTQLWNFGEDSVWSSSGNYTFTNTNTDHKPIRRKVSVLTENTLGCQTVSFFWVTVFPNPVAKIGVRSEGGSPENVFLSSLSTNTTACQWLFPDGTSSQGCDDVLIRLFNNGFYKIQLRSSNQYGCTDTTSVVHQTIIKGLFVPNAFQPTNASKDVNIFKPVGIGLQTYYLGIYDVWGNPIWETDKLINSQPAEGWDGRTNKGISLPMDAYIWRIKAVFIDGTLWKGMKGKDGILRTEGTVTLIK